MRRYLIQDVIGSGGMGAVYRARDMHFPNAVKLVAIKEMVSSTADQKINEMMVKNFEREANLLVSLSHPSIPNIYDYFTIDQRAYLVLEYIYGKDLEKILDRTTDFIPENQVISWSIQLCDVLSYLHSHEPEPIIFRDIKPSNVMINRHGNVVLVDFGIAKHFQIGQKGTIIGTEGYAPPEQYRGEATPAVDIYALGATLHHILTRRDPTLEAPFTFDQRKVSDYNPTVSKELEAIVERALAYESGERYSTAEEMKDALLKIGANMGQMVTPSGHTFQPISAEVKNQVDAGSAEQLIKPVWTFQCEDEIRGSAAITDDGLYVGSYDHNLYKLDPSNGHFIWKYPTEGGIVSTPVIDNGLAFFGSEDHSIYSVYVNSGRLNWSYKTHGPIRSTGVLATDHLFIGSDDCAVYALNQSNGHVSWKYESMAAIRTRPIIYRDQLYFGSMTGEIICSDMAGQLRWRFNAKRAIVGSPIIDRDGFLYTTSLDGTFYALDAKSGWAIWRFRMNKGSVSTPVIHEDKLFIGSADGNVYCIEKENGRQLWSHSIHSQVSGSPFVYEKNLYIGAADGDLYCLDHQTGKLNWKFHTQGLITSTPVVGNDLIYFSSTDHFIYALAI